MRPAGLVLAGGAGARMGGAVPKPLLDIGGRPILSHVLARLDGHCDPVLLSAADTPEIRAFVHEIVPDRRPVRLGPLAGLEAAAGFLHANGSGATHLLSLPGDTPFLPADTVPRLVAANDGRVAVARSAGRLHPTVALWPLAALAGLSAALDAKDADLSLLAFMRTAGMRPVDFAPEAGAPDGDPFFNVNTPGDLERARRFAKDCHFP